MPPNFLRTILWFAALVYNWYFFRTAVLRKLFDIRFSYRHRNFSRVCLLVKMASKTVTRSIFWLGALEFKILKFLFFRCLYIFRWPFHSSAMLFRGSLPNNFLRFSKVEFSHFSTYLKLFSFRRKRKPKIFIFENAMERITRKKFSLSQNSKLHLKFSAK